MDMDEPAQEIEIRGYAAYTCRLTRREALRALLGRPVKLPGGRVSPHIPLTAGRVSVTCWGGGGAAGGPGGNGGYVPGQGWVAGGGGVAGGATTFRPGDGG